MSEIIKFQHIIREKWCKGCNICVVFCPKKVLELKDNKVFVKNPGFCIGCHLCEYRCPDFAIEVKEIAAEKKHERDALDLNYNISPETDHV